MVGSKVRFNAYAGEHGWVPEFEDEATALHGQEAVVSAIEIEDPNGAPLYISVQFDSGAHLDVINIVHFEPVRAA
jgi:hypothetical protein